MDISQTGKTMQPVKNPAGLLMAVSKERAVDLVTHGINITEAMNTSPAKANAYLYKGITELVQMVDANKTLSGESDVAFTIEAIKKDYPWLTIEEVLFVLSKMAKGHYGKFYERLKTPEIIEALRQYDTSERIEILEQKNRARDKDGVELTGDIYQGYKPPENKKRGERLKEIYYQAFKAEYLSKREKL